MHEEGSPERNERNRWKGPLIIVLIILLLLLLLWQCHSDKEQPSSGNVTFGVIDIEQTDPNTGEKIDLQERANAAVEENMFRVFISTRMEVSAEGAFKPLIQNTEMNHHACWVEIIDDDSTTIWASDIIQPGYKIEEAVLTKQIVRGKHDCKAVFHAIGADGQEVNSVNVNVTLIQR